MPPWKAKALLQQTFSHVPAGDRLNYQFQRRLTRGLPISDVALSNAIDLSVRHADGLARHSAVPIADGRFFEFGAGWDLHQAQTLYCLGANHQVVVDLRRLLQPDLVFDIRDRLARLERDLPRRPPSGHDDLDQYLDAMGIEYSAPSDARSTGLPTGSVQFITSTSTLEHIPPEDIRSILVECRRLLADDGAMSCIVDYLDHYSFFDSNITGYNYLRYSPTEWKKYNSSLHFQNRLRHSDYLQLFAECGFTADEVNVEEGRPEDQHAVAALDIDDTFRAYSPDDLIARNAAIVLT